MFSSRPQPSALGTAWQYGEGAARVLGPAFLVSVSHVDPGDWATAIEGGSRFGMKLVWVVVVSHLIAIHLQNLAARLGLVTGQHLAQVCRRAYPRLVCWLLWLLCEVSIVALDLTMVLGTALGLSLLLRLPLLPCILASGLDTLLLLLLPRLGMARAEQLTVALLAAIVLCFLVELVIVKPPLAAVAGGLWPSLDRDSLYAVVSLLGANVMPHNFYLHSALVAGRAGGGRSTAALLRWNAVDISLALGVALLVNVAVLVVAAQTFHVRGIVVHTLQDAHDMMERLLSSATAPAAFGLALLCAGQLSTFTGTISGQVVLQGFLNVKLPTWQRRLITRSAAVVPAALLQHLWGDQGTFQLLVMLQVVLALALPFTLVPLIQATSSRALMGAWASGPASRGLSWAACGLSFGANLLLLLHWLFPDEEEDGELLDAALALAAEQPLRLLGVVALIVLASAALALLAWMICTPFGGDFHDGLHPATPAPLQLLQPPAGEDLESATSLPGLPPAKPRLAEIGLQPLARPEQHEQKRALLPPLPLPPPTEQAQAEPPRPAAAERSWEDGAPDLLAADVADIRRDLRQAGVPVLATPRREREQEPSAGGRGPEQLGALHQDASTSGLAVQDGYYDMPQGARREAALLASNLWAGLFDLHGKALPASRLAALLDGLAAQPLPLPGPQQQQQQQRGQEQQWAGPVAAALVQALRALAALPGGAAMFVPHCEGQLLAAEEAMRDLVLAPEEDGPPPGDLGALPPSAAVDRGELLLLLQAGLWCAVRLLELARQEPRPELWGRYALGLNRLQGVLRAANLAVTAPGVAQQLQLLVREVEAAVTARKGPSGTAAGHVAFPKGKEIIFSVLKRYRRALTPPEPPAGPRLRPTSVLQAAALLALFGCLSLAVSGPADSSLRGLRVMQLV